MIVLRGSEFIRVPRCPTSQLKTCKSFPTYTLPVGARTLASLRVSCGIHLRPSPVSFAGCERRELWSVVVVQVEVVCVL